MRVKYTRPAVGGFGAFAATESMVEDLPDTDAADNPMPVPSGAVKVDDATPTHDWQRDGSGGYPRGGGK